MEVEEFDANVYRLLGERHKEDILERLWSGDGLLARKPFLEEGGEGVAIDYFTAFFVGDSDVSVALVWQLVESRASAIPML